MKLLHLKALNLYSREKEGEKGNEGDGNVQKGNRNYSHLKTFELLLLYQVPEQRKLATPRCKGF